MATGKEGPTTGLAKQFAEYVRSESSRHGYSTRQMADLTGLSHGYYSKRARGDAAFTVRDVALLAKVFGVSTSEILLRASFPAAADYPGRLVPEYGVQGDIDGLHLFRIADADPPLRSERNNVTQLRPVSPVPVTMAATTDMDENGEIDGPHTE